MLFADYNRSMTAIGPEALLHVWHMVMHPVDAFSMWSIRCNVPRCRPLKAVLGIQKPAVHDLHLCHSFMCKILLPTWNDCCRGCSSIAAHIWSHMGCCMQDLPEKSSMGVGSNCNCGLTNPRLLLPTIADTSRLACYAVCGNVHREQSGWAWA